MPRLLLWALLGLFSVETLAGEDGAKSCVWEERNCAWTHSDACRWGRYKGNRSTTVNDFTCQRWDSQTPHAKYTSTRPSDGAAHNFCRSSNGAALPWCYTKHPRKRHQPCYRDCVARNESGVGCAVLERQGRCLVDDVLLSCRNASRQPRCLAATLPCLERNIQGPTVLWWWLKVKLSAGDYFFARELATLSLVYVLSMMGNGVCLWGLGRCAAEGTEVSGPQRPILLTEMATATGSMLFYLSYEVLRLSRATLTCHAPWSWYHSTSVAIGPMLGNLFFLLVAVVDRVAGIRHPVWYRSGGRARIARLCRPWAVLGGSLAFAYATLALSRPTLALRHVPENPCQIVQYYAAAFPERASLPINVISRWNLARHDRFCDRNSKSLAHIVAKNLFYAVFLGLAFALVIASVWLIVVYQRFLEERRSKGQTGDSSIGATSNERAREARKKSWASRRAKEKDNGLASPRRLALLVGAQAALALLSTVIVVLKNECRVSVHGGACVPLRTAAFGLVALRGVAAFGFYLALSRNFRRVLWKSLKLG